MDTFNEIENFLFSLKLNKYEAKTYLTLLKHGPQDFKELNKLTGVGHRKIYSTLKSLAKKGWITSLEKKPKIFTAKYPETPLRKYLMSLKEFYSLTVPF